MVEGKADVRACRFEHVAVAVREDSKQIAAASEPLESSGHRSPAVSNGRGLPIAWVP
jgi:hypothetical protein